MLQALEELPLVRHSLTKFRLEVEKSRESHSFKPPHNLDMKCIVFPPSPKSLGFRKILFQAKKL